MGIKIPGFTRKRKKMVSYFFYRPLTEAWSEKPAVLISGLDGSHIKMMYDDDRLMAENEDGLVWATNPITPQIIDEADLFSGFNNWIGDLYRAEVILGPINGGPIYLERSGYWTITSDVCREFLESVYYNVTGIKVSFR